MLSILQFTVWLIIAGMFAKASIKRKTTGTGMSARTDTFLRVPTALTGAGVLVAAGILLSSFGTVGAGERGVVQRFGAVTGRVIEPGLYMVTPVVESVHPMNVQVQKETAKAAAVSKTIQSVTTEIALNYSINPARAATLYKNVGDEYKTRIIDPAIQEAVKAVTAQYNTENLISDRHLVKENLTNELRTRLEPLGITVEAISLTDFQFTPEFAAAIEAKQTATQQALKAENDLKTVEFEAKQRVAQANGEAEAIKIQAQAIQAQGGKEYVNLKAIEKWNGQLPTQILGSAPMPFITVNK